MKKPLLLLTAALLLAGAACAQWSVSSVFGANIATLSDLGKSGNFKFVPKTSFYAGIGTAYKVSPAFGVKAELLYSRQGYSVVARKSFLDEDEQSWRLKTRLNYLSLPVMLRFAIPSWDKIGIELGGQAGYLLGVWQLDKDVYKYSDGTNIQKDVYRDRIKLDADDYNRFDYGLTGGLFFNVARKAVFSVRYYHGLENIYKDSDRDEQNRVISIGLTQKF